LNNSTTNVHNTINEKVRDYEPNSNDRKNLKKKLDEMSSQKYKIPVIIDGNEIFTNETSFCLKPHNHKDILATYHKSDSNEINVAIESCNNAWTSWSQTTLLERCEIFQRAAKLLAGPWRDTINAATMLNQSKNVYQAEIDSACELIDFFNFNVKFAQEIYNNQPLISPQGMKNYLEYRPLEGFVFAVTPFNFTSIAGNLPTAPVLMGNVSIWKPASSSVYSNYFIMKLLEEAGLPDGVINFLPGSGSKIGNPIVSNTHLAGVHFTGSTKVFQGMWNQIGNNIANYKTYPRIVGETGGKDFILAHPSTNKEALVTAMIRGAFEYQGQKCSAASRCYIPKNIWDEIKDQYISEVKSIKMGDVEDFSNFMNAVIDENAFDSIVSYIDYAKNSNNSKIITGGNYNKEIGFFIEPTTIVTSDPYFKTMVDEIFGPVLTIYVYNNSWEDICKIVDNTSPYGLTGAIFAEDNDALKYGTKKLAFSAGNFYINDKPTGAVVGQQPFGGSRASGTNDKAGSPLNLLRWISQRTIKETFNPPKNYKYPFMKEK
tara:strand:+ start:741 stop:2372 length:1632 start_codon:yes stop_codon:yes gene_type:complete